MSDKSEKTPDGANGFDWSKALEVSEESRAKALALGVNPKFLDRPLTTPEQARQKVQDFLKHLPEHVARFNALLDRLGNTSAAKQLRIDPRNINAYRQACGFKEPS